MRHVFSAFLILAFLAPLLRGQPALSPGAAAAKKRQEAVKTLKVVFKRTEVEGAGSASANAPRGLKPSTPVPARETTIESENRLFLDGDKVRYEDNHPLWEISTGKLRKMDSVYAFDGTLAKLLHPYSNHGGPLGSIEKAAYQEKVKSYELTPLTVTFRGLNPAICPDALADAKPSGVTLPINGESCQEYVLARSSLVISLWMDPTKDYVIRRISKQRNGKIVEQHDITYQRNALVGWVPESWARHFYLPEGGLQRTGKMKVLEMELNTAQPHQQFDLQFPPGTWVFDQRTMKDYRVQPDGSMSEVVPERKESAVGIDEPWYRRNVWLLCVLGAATLLAAFGYVVLKRKKLVAKRSSM